MMGEEGFYESDEELFFQRVHLLWRAMRILLDVGLHTRGMTRDQAVDQMVNELHVERGNAEAEVRRYLRLARVSAVLCRGPARAAALARRFPQSEGQQLLAARVSRRRAPVRRPARHLDSLGTWPG